MKYVISTIALALAFGCARAPQPLAGGKPVSHWLEAVQDTRATVRKEAVTKLGNVGPTDERALPAVSAALKDNDPDVRRAAILALVKFGPAAKEAVPVLAVMVEKDKDDKVRSYAGKALEKLRATDR